MMEEILTEARNSTYDFRLAACLNDPEQDRWPEWVDYYKLKRAFAAIVKPSSIVEVGVRYGYSALAFLDACPETSYLGIDDGLEHWGGTPGAVGWAKQQLPSSAIVIEDDIFNLDELPHSDLVHLDGPQDAEGWIHQITLATQSAKWILIDGAFHADGASDVIHKELTRWLKELSWWTWTGFGYGQVLAKVSE